MTTTHALPSDTHASETMGLDQQHNFLPFRSYRIALTADIEKIIAINSPDLLHLIWVDDIHKEKPASKVFSFNRIIKGS